MNDLDNNPLTLAIETAQATGSVTLGAGEAILGSIELSRDKRDRKGVELMPAIQMLFESHGRSPSDLKRILISTGPGSFTGLRVGITVAKMLGQFGGAEIYPVSTLPVTAWQAYARLEGDEGRDLPMTVALAVKQQTVYGEIFKFQDGMPMPYIESDEVGRLVPMTELILDERQQVVVEWPERLEAILGEDLLAENTLVVREKQIAELHASSVYQFGARLLKENKLEAIDPMALTPEYIRPPEAVTLWDARHGPEA